MDNIQHNCGVRPNPLTLDHMLQWSTFCPKSLIGILTILYFVNWKYEQASGETTYNIWGILGMRQRICGGRDQKQTLSCWWHPSMWSSTVCHHSNALYLPIAVITPWHIQKGIHEEGMLDPIGFEGHTVLIYCSLEETL